MSNGTIPLFTTPGHKPYLSCEGICNGGIKLELSRRQRDMPNYPFLQLDFKKQNQTQTMTPLAVGFNELLELLGGKCLADKFFCLGKKKHLNGGNGST